MANTTPTPNHQFPVPTLTDQGPDYANNINTCLNEIDTALGGTVTGPGTAVVDLSQQPTTGDISADGHNLSNVRSVEFQNQSGILTGSQDVNCVYVNQNNLGFNNSDGYFVPITSGNTLAITTLPFTNLIFGPTSGTVTTNTVILPNATYNALNVDTSGGAVTITLPIISAITPTKSGRCFFINDWSNSFATHNCTISVPGGSGDLLYGPNFGARVTSFPLTSAGESVLIYTDGTNQWYMLAFNSYNFNTQVVTFTNGSTLRFDVNSAMWMPGYFLPNTSTSTTLAGVVTIGSLGPDNGQIVSTLASGIQSTVAAGITSTVTGGISGGVVSGIQSGTTSGIQLSGGPSDWVTFANNRSRSFAAPLIPAQGSLTSGWVASTTDVIGIFGPANTSLQPLSLPVQHNGATLQSVTMFLKVSTHSGPPATFPSMQIKRRDLAAGIGSDAFLSSTHQQFASGTWTSGLVTSFNYTCDQNNVINTDQFLYFIELTDENGTGSASDNNYYGMLLNYGGISDMRFP